MDNKIENQIEVLQGLIRGLQLKVTRIISATTEKENITIAQHRVLIALASTGPAPMNHLAKVLNVTTPALTHLVDKLEEHKVLKRTMNPDDRRSFTIELTPKGEEILRVTQGKIFKMLTSVLVNFSDSERLMLINFYQKMNEKLDGENKE